MFYFFTVSVFVTENSSLKKNCNKPIHLEWPILAVDTGKDPGKDPKYSIVTADFF